MGFTFKLHINLPEELVFDELIFVRRCHFPKYFVKGIGFEYFVGHKTLFRQSDRVQVCNPSDCF